MLASVGKVRFIMMLPTYSFSILFHPQLAEIDYYQNRFSGCYGMFHGYWCLYTTDCKGSDFV